MTPAAITIAKADPRTAQATGLLQASHLLMQSMFPPETNHYLSIDALCAPHIHFVTATKRDLAETMTLGCGALAAMEGYGEIKSMFVAPEARGMGVGEAILRELEDHARSLGLPVLRLETGDTLHAAHRLYERLGFSYRGPFGAYEDGPHSVFMGKKLT